MDKPPIKNSYPVHLGLRIFAGEYPGAKDEETCHKKLLGTTYWSSIKYFYDLTCEGEFQPYAQYLNESQQHRRFPIPDCGIPASTTEVAQICMEITSGCEEQAGKYIHCWGGVGRTGTIVACLYAYLMKGTGLNADEMYSKAMQQLKESFSKCPKSTNRVSPENDLQRNFVRRFIENECV